MGSGKRLNLQLSPYNFYDSIIPSKRTSKIQNGRRGLEMCLPLGFLNKFSDPSAPSMREVDNGEKLMSFLVVTNVVASRPPECRPSGTPHTRANNNNNVSLIFYPILTKLGFGD